MKNNITMKDIAEKLGVSNVTISKALNDKDGVSDELKEKIKNLAEDMGYRVNTVAKSMKEGISYNIGVILAERFTGEMNSFYLEFYKHIASTLEKYNYYGILQIINDKDEQELNLPRIYYERKVDGFIVLGQVSKEYVDTLQKIDIPVVCLDFYDEHNRIDTVITDSFYSTYEITNYLIKNGHRDIAYIGNIYATSSIQDRFLGYYKSLLEHRIELKDEYVIKDRDEKGAFIELDMPEKMPTAFVCNCDKIAYQLIKRLKNEGYNIPGDISVVGFDNDIYSTISEPQITTVEVDIETMSETVVKAIISKVKNDDVKYGRVLIKGNIIYRDSVASLKQGN
ncbi:LacI family DNA-binding transcriptional regulator [Clostridium sp. DL1XJH146]